MAGYSSTPLPKKLGIKEGHRVAVLAAPDGFDTTLGAPPPGAVIRRDARGAHALDVIVLFSKGRADLEKRLGPATRALSYDGGLWVAWPKKASGMKTDLTEDVVRALALAGGLVDNKVCAIDDVWSGLRLVYRLEDRPKKA